MTYLVTVSGDKIVALTVVSKKKEEKYRTTRRELNVDGTCAVRLFLENDNSQLVTSLEFSEKIKIQRKRLSANGRSFP